MRCVSFVFCSGVRTWHHLRLDARVLHREFGHGLGLLRRQFTNLRFVEATRS